MALPPEQRAGLWRAKLRRLAHDHFDRVDGVDHDAPWGCAVDNDGAWTALIEVAPERSFGQALVLAAGHDAHGLDLLVEGDAGPVARRAGLFEPAPVVWQIEGVALTAATPQVLQLATAPALREDLADLLALDDVDIIVEHGSIIGECRGLEVARVTGEGVEQRLDVGVGAYDQGAFAVMNPHLTPVESLAEVVAQVLTHRRRGAAPHPINRFARERWVRSELLADPSSLGLVSLEPVEPMSPRDGIKDVAPASAVGVASSGERVVVVCTVGIDLDAVPSAADLAEVHDADRILIVLPDRDRHALVEAVAARSRRSIEFVTAPEPWAEPPDR